MIDSFINLDIRVEGKDYNVQRLLIGTHTSGGEPNYLQIATVQLPNDDVEVDAHKFDEERKGTHMCAHLDDSYF